MGLKRVSLVWAATTVAAMIAVPQGDAQHRKNGQDWRNWTRDERVFYVAGYMEGRNTVLGEVMIDEQLGIGEQYTNEKKPKLAAIARLADSVPSKLTNGDIVDGLDRFYDEPANRLIALPYAIGILALKVNGRPAEFIEQQILRGREIAMKETQATQAK
jgi:hypothetical protein